MHLSGELFNAMAGIKTLHVPFKGSPEAVNSVMKNEVSFMFPNAPNAIPLAKGGKIKLLAVTSAKRLSWLPDVPPRHTCSHSEQVKRRGTKSTSTPRSERGLA